MSTIPRFPLIAGLILCAYAVYVEYRHSIEEPDSDEHFQALCDIEALKASCSNVFALPQGRLLSYFGIVPEHSVLDVPNAALGLAHFILMLIVKDSAPLQPLVQFLVMTSFATTVFLAYQLTFVIPELCILCWSSHVINTYVLYRCFFDSSSDKGLRQVSKKKAV